GRAGAFSARSRERAALCCRSIFRIRPPGALRRTAIDLAISSFAESYAASDLRCDMRSPGRRFEGTMKRRRFFGLVAGAAAWPVAAPAQHGAGMRCLVVLAGYAANDSLGKLLATILPRGLAALGWTEGQNIQSDQIQADNQSQDSTGYGTS